MPNLDNRIIFDTKTGEIHHQTYEAVGDVLPHKKINGLDYLDIPFGSIDYNTCEIIGIDLETKKPIIRLFDIVETEEQKRIRELEEDIKLLQADANLGGIL